MFLSAQYESVHGDIDFVDIPAGQESYWVLPMTGAIAAFVLISVADRHPALTVQGNAVSLPSGSSSFAAIDTGTTLVGGPQSVIRSIFGQIPGSAQGTGDYESYWTYREYVRRR